MDLIDPRTDPFITPRWRGELPHLYKPGGSYFITFRLHDAVLPRARRATHESPPDWDHVAPEDLLSDYDPPLTLGSRVLHRPEVAQLVQSKLLEHHLTRYELAAWCVMPNHVHGVFTPLAGFSAEKILQSWKGGSAVTINRLLSRQGTLWECESFDHLIRNTESFERFVTYTEMNPVAAGLVSRAVDWPFSSAGCKEDAWCRLKPAPP